MRCLSSFAPTREPIRPFGATGRVAALQESSHLTAVDHLAIPPETVLSFANEWLSYNVTSIKWGPGAATLAENR
jgi:hypothetical protein